MTEQEIYHLLYLADLAPEKSSAGVDKRTEDWNPCLYVETAGEQGRPQYEWLATFEPGKIGECEYFAAMSKPVVTELCRLALIGLGKPNPHL